MMASECAPVAQAGGLAEVVFGLSRELERRVGLAAPPNSGDLSGLIKASSLISPTTNNITLGVHRTRGSADIPLL